MREYYSLKCRKMINMEKNLAKISLRGQRRLILVDTFCQCIKPNSHRKWLIYIYMYMACNMPKGMCVIDRHDITIAVKVALNANTINQSYCSVSYILQVSLQTATLDHDF